MSPRQTWNRWAEGNQPHKARRGRPARIGLVISTLVAMLLVVDPGSACWGEEWIFRAADHGMTGEFFVLSAGSGNVWLSNIEHTIRFDGLAFSRDEGPVPLAADGRGQLWSFLPLDVLLVDGPALPYPRYWFVPDYSPPPFGSIFGPDPVYSLSDTAFIGVRYFPPYPSNDLIAGHWNNDLSLGLSPGVPRLFSIALPQGVTLEARKSLSRLNDGSIWLSVDDALYFRSGDGWALSPIDNPYSPPLYRSPRDGTLWFGKADSLVGWLERAKVRCFETPGVGFVASVFEDPSGHLWAQGHEGLAIRVRGGWMRIPRPIEVPVNSRTGVAAADSSGNIWSTHSDGTGGSLLVRSDGTYEIGLAGLPPPVFESTRGTLLSNHGDSLLVRRGDSTRWIPSAGKPIFEDASGEIWLGSATGLSRMDRDDTVQPVAAWPSPAPTFLVARASGDSWFKSAAGLLRYRDGAWTSFPYNSPPNLKNVVGGPNSIWAAFPDSGIREFDTDELTWRAGADPIQDPEVGFTLTIDSQGNPWLAILDGRVLRRDESGTWVEELNTVNAADLFEDAQGRMCVAGFENDAAYAVLRRDSGGWTRPFGYFDFRAYYLSYPVSVLRDARGVPWMVGWSATRGWVAFIFEEEGGRDIPLSFSDRNQSPVFLDSDDQLWYSDHVARLDRTAPITKILNPPALRTPLSTISLAFTPMLESSTGIEYRTRIGTGPWSGWSATPGHDFSLPQDGKYCLMVQARDRWGNIEPVPQQACFELDATPPGGSLVGTPSRIPDGDSLAIIGTATDAHFASYSVSITPIRCGQADTTRTRTLGPFTTKVTTTDTLAVFGGLTTGWEDGHYVVTLRVQDDLGLVGTTELDVLLDRSDPPAEFTSPATCSNESGCEIYAEGGSVYLTLPPHSLDADPTVRVDYVHGPISGGAVPSGVAQVGDAVAVTWNPRVPVRPGVLSVRVGSTCESAGSGEILPVVAYRLSGNDSWERVGGTPRGTSGWFDVLTESPGTYALFREDTPATSPQASLGAELALSPRVLHPNGASGGAAVVLSFSLEAPGRVSAYVHNRAGRRVRVLAEGTSFDRGVQSLRWDGRDDHGQAVADDLYLLTVRTPTRTLRGNCLVQSP